MELKDEHYEQRIRYNYQEFRESEKKVADFILAQGSCVEKLNLKELAGMIETSEATILRCIKAMGYNGYGEFKINLVKDLRHTNNNLQGVVDIHVSKGDDIKDIPQKIIHMTTRALQDTLNMLKEDDFLKVIELIIRAKNIDIYGVGNSAVVAQDIMNKFIRIGIRCRAFADSHVQHICACSLSSEDVAIGISHSGETRDVVEALRLAREAGASTIALTNYKAEGITKYADIALLTGEYETTFYSETMVSRSSQLAIVDMIYMGVLLRDYDRFTKTLSKVNECASKKVM